MCFRLPPEVSALLRDRSADTKTGALYVTQAVPEEGAVLTAAERSAIEYACGCAYFGKFLTDEERTGKMHRIVVVSCVSRPRSAAVNNFECAAGSCARPRRTFRS